MKIYFFYLSMLLLTASCSQRNLVYFSDMNHRPVIDQPIRNDTEPRIQPNDLLRISVTSLSPEANILFNKGEVIAVGATHVSGSGATNFFEQGYLVDKEGYIDFPVLGKLHLSGLNKTEAKARLNASLEQYLEKPMVSIQYLNFKVTVVGEVGQPATFNVPSERINVVEALGMAGDMTVFGKRENVLIIREEQGRRTVARLNLNSAEVFQSPYFYLKQNDIVYVEPVKAREEASNMFKRNLSFGISIVSILTVIFTRF